MSKITSVRGMNDLPPEEVRVWTIAEEMIKKVFNSFKRQSKDGINFEIKNNKEETYTKYFDKKLFEKLRKKYKV